MEAPPQALAAVVHSLSQDQLISYAHASGDYNPLHLAPDFAAGTSYGRPIAHGMLVLAFLSEMLTGAFGLDWFAGGKLQVRFRAPAYPGDTISADGALQALSGDGQQAMYRVACTNQSGTQVITGEATVPRTPRRR